MNFKNLDKLVQDGYVSRQQHPITDLYIYNYTQKTQFEGYWTEETLACRGLIMDYDGNVVARPFGKFFNMEEHESSEIPNLPFKAFEKMDGSCGILYWICDQPFIATRGSFVSDQAQKANQMLLDKYKDTWEKLDRDCTYIFEIIYPENRIVVDYGTEEKLVLLAVRNTLFDTDYHLEDIGFPIVKEYDGINDFKAMKALNTDNSEGFVILFANGFRIKIKFEEYVRLHRIITGVSNKTIWEYLKNDIDFDELLEKVPDEFFDWVKATKSDLLNKHMDIFTIAKIDFNILRSTVGTDDRKLFAEHALQTTNPKLMFLMLDGKSTDSFIWNMLKPEFQKPFSNKNDINYEKT